MSANGKFPSQKAVVLVSLIIAIVSAVVAVSSFVISRQQYALAEKALSDLHDFNRRQNAMQLVSQWDEKTLASRQAIYVQWPDSFSRNFEIEYREIEELREKQLAFLKANPGPYSGTPLITEHMTRILNFFETIATAISSNTADEDMLRHSFGNTFKRWYVILGGFREEIIKKRAYNPWEPIDDLNRRWGTAPPLNKSVTGKP
jgi:hypothetical protein